MQRRCTQCSDDSSHDPGHMTIDTKLLDILACPLCITALSQMGDWLVCATCGRRYPIREGIPILLVDEAEIAPAPDEGR